MKVILCFALASQLPLNPILGDEIPPVRLGNPIVSEYPIRDVPVDSEKFDEIFKACVESQIALAQPDAGSEKATIISHIKAGRYLVSLASIREIIDGGKVFYGPGETVVMDLGTEKRFADGEVAFYLSRTYPTEELVEVGSETLRFRKQCREPMTKADFLYRLKHDDAMFSLQRGIKEEKCASCRGYGRKLGKTEVCNECRGVGVFRNEVHLYVKW